MKTPYFLLLGLLLVAPGHAADPGLAGPAPRTLIFGTPDAVGSADPPGCRLQSAPIGEHARLVPTDVGTPANPARDIFNASIQDADAAKIALGGSGLDSRPDSVRFEAVDVFVDSGDNPLAAYQFELKAKSGEVLLAGLEGGDPPAFRSSPYYDPTALLQNKVVVAAFSTAADLPHGKTRVARLMVQVTGLIEPAYDATLSVAGSIDGKPIAAARISVATERAESAAPASPVTSKPSQSPNASEGVVR